MRTAFEKAIQVIEDTIRNDPTLLHDPRLQKLARLFKGAAADPTTKPDFSHKPRWSDEMKKTKAEGRRNPAQFIREVYREELLSNLSRADLLKSDEQLYFAYARWIHSERHPEDNLNLITREKNELKGPQEAIDFVRKINRISARKHRAKKLKKT